MKNATFLTIQFFVLLSLSACTWVKPTQLGSEVRYIEQTDRTFESCTKLGTMTSMVKDKIGPTNRSKEKVDIELITIAKNEAVEMGGDTIVPTGPVKNGRREFTVYRCIK